MPTKYISFFIIISNEKIQKIHTLSGSLIVFSFSSKPTLDNLEIFCNFTGVDLYNLTEYLSSLLIIITYIKIIQTFVNVLIKASLVFDEYYYIN